MLQDLLVCYFTWFWKLWRLCIWFPPGTLINFAVVSSIHCQATITYLINTQDHSMPFHLSQNLSCFHLSFTPSEYYFSAIEIIQNCIAELVDMYQRCSLVSLCWPCNQEAMKYPKTLALYSTEVRRATDHTDKQLVLFITCNNTETNSSPTQKFSYTEPTVFKTSSCRQPVVSLLTVNNCHLLSNSLLAIDFWL